MLNRMEMEIERGVEVQKPPHERGELFCSHSSVADREAFSCCMAAAGDERLRGACIEQHHDFSAFGGGRAAMD